MDTNKDTDQTVALLPSPVRPIVRKKTSDYSRTCWNKTLVLHTEVAQRFFERNYGRIDFCLYRFNVFIQFSQAKKTKGFTDKLDAIFKKFNDMVEAGLTNFNQAFVEAGATEEDRAIQSHPRTYRMACFSPECKNRFLPMMMKFDELMNALDTAWGLGLMNTEAKRTTTAQWLREINRFRDELFTLRKEINDTLSADAKEKIKEQSKPEQKLDLVDEAGTVIEKLDTDVEDEALEETEQKVEKPKKTRAAKAKKDEENTESTE